MLGLDHHPSDHCAIHSGAEPVQGPLAHASPSHHVASSSQPQLCARGHGLALLQHPTVRLLQLSLESCVGKLLCPHSNVRLQSHSTLVARGGDWGSALHQFSTSVQDCWYRNGWTDVSQLLMAASNQHQKSPVLRLRATAERVTQKSPQDRTP